MPSLDWYGTRLVAVWAMGSQPGANPHADTRQLVGWAMSAPRDEALVETALRMALARRTLPVEAETIHHTDRGRQYTADDYLTLLATTPMQVSISGKANPYANAMIESFFSTLRAELTDWERFPSRNAARQAVFEFIEGFSNRQRLHSSLGYCNPLNFEAAHTP
jgi:putative transposase